MPLYYTLDDIQTVKGHRSEEVETTITLERLSDTATIYTNNNVTINKIKRLMSARPDAWSLIDIFYNADGTPSGYKFSCHKKCVSLRNPAPKKELTDEQRAIVRENMRQLHSKHRI